MHYHGIITYELRVFIFDSFVIILNAHWTDFQYIYTICDQNTFPASWQCVLRAFNTYFVRILNGSQFLWQICEIVLFTLMRRQWLFIILYIEHDSIKRDRFWIERRFRRSTQDETFHRITVLQRWHRFLQRLTVRTISRFLYQNKKNPTPSRPIII